MNDESIVDFCDVTAVKDGYIKGATEQHKIDEEALSKVKEVYHKAGYEQGYTNAVEKICEWLKTYRQDTFDGMGYIAGIVNDQTIEDLKKAMEQ